MELRVKLLNRHCQRGPADTRIVGAAILGVAALVVVVMASLALGARAVAVPTLLASLAGGDGGADATIILHARLPRTLAGLIAGVALGLSGALIQAVSRNPLSDPGILGINAGAGLAVAMTILYFGALAPGLQFAAGIGGALVAVLLVFALGAIGGGRSDPAHFIVAGMALGALTGGLTSALTLLNPALFDRMRFWTAGTLDVGDLGLVLAVMPVVAVGTTGALALARPLNALALGKDIAASLGARPEWVQMAALGLVAVLCGTCTALTGPIGFVGLMAPHIARRLVGPDMRRVLPFCMIFAPILLLAADIVGRVAIAAELRVSIVTAFLGAPMLIAIARGRTR